MGEDVLGFVPKSVAAINERCNPDTLLSRNVPLKTVMVVVAGRLFRDGIQRVLASPERTVVGDCETLDQVAGAIEAHGVPDLLVVGIGAGERAAAAFEQIRKLRGRIPGARWIVLGCCTDIEFLRGAVETGVEGLLREDSSGEVLQLLAELVLLGHSFVPAELGRILSENGGARLVTGVVPVTGGEAASFRAEHPCAVATTVHEAGRETPAAEAMPVPVPARPSYGAGLAGSFADPFSRRQISLSERETEILHCLVAGSSNKMIARELQIAEATVKVHVKALLRKMQVANRTQAAISALHILNAAGNAASNAAGNAAGNAASDAAGHNAANRPELAARSEKVVELPVSPGQKNGAVMLRAVGAIDLRHCAVG